MATVFLNGSFVTPDEALISAFDAGFQHGVGLFETMLGIGSPGERARVIHLGEHLDRLAASAAELNLSEHLRVGALADAVQRTVDKAAENGPSVARFRIRLTITGGDLNMLAAAKAGEPREQAPTLMIHAQPATLYPAEMFTRGVLVTIADWKANPLDAFQGHKTLNYWPRLRELQIAGSKRAAEALILQVTNHLSGGCVSNAFVLRDGTLYTPIARGEEEDVLENSEPSATEDEPNNYDPPVRGAALPSPVLPGVVRRWVMDWALSEGLNCERRMITIRDVLDADEIFLTNSSWGVLPVSAVEAQLIGGGKVGPIAKQLVEAWSQLIA
jgi:branched-subunit amino acid aminotransferase/4-amino-4-deoxychorismate lyase